LEDSIPPVVTSPKVTLVTPEMKHPTPTATPTVSAPPHLAPADGVAWAGGWSPASRHSMTDSPHRAQSSASLPGLEEAVKPPAATPLKKHLSPTVSTTADFLTASFVQPRMASHDVPVSTGGSRP
jgi:hypothetical protein